MERSLLERVELEEANTALQLDAERQRERLEAMSERNTALEARVEQLTAQAATSSEQLQQLADAFRLHLEQLVAIRERIDAHDEDARQIDDSPVEEEHARQLNGGEEENGESPQSPESLSLLIAGLSAVSDKCLRWFHHHVAQTYARIQEKAALYESQHAELEQLRDRVRSIRSDHELSVAKETQQAVLVLQLQQANSELERARRSLADAAVDAQPGPSSDERSRPIAGDGGPTVPTLVRSEIKKKFGYVPDAIAHTDHWSRILDALDLLERQLRIATR
ncbi:hypothetical protein PINS_up023197 [Pythium insidiosum]|nr:hypothetical protein PINS_up023197 [Pythium insidiosum]